MSVRCREEGEVARVTLEGPHHNAIDAATWQAITVTFTELATRASLRCVVIEGAGGNFAAGAEIGEFPALRSDLAGVRHYHEHVIAPALQALCNCPVPVLAQIEGDCVGGGLEIAATCDLRYAADNARFGVPIGRLGFSMAPDEMEVLVRSVGETIAAELLFEGRLLSAAEAFERGLITRVVKSAALLQAVNNAVARVLAQAPIAQRINKRLLRSLRRGPLDDAARTDAFSYAETSDHREGVRAFIEGRPPRFSNS
jgi:enoyl-CoA hydratase/carnithine racemase